jgi:ribosomal protein S13
MNYAQGKKGPGEAMQSAMNRLEPHLRPLFLQEQELRAKREGDLELLREIKAYKALVSSPTTSNPTSTTPRPTD